MYDSIYIFMYHYRSLLVILLFVYQPTVDYFLKIFSIEKNWWWQLIKEKNDTVDSHFLFLFIKSITLSIMSSDWDSVTIIGQKARVGGGGPRKNVAKTSSQLNAARRAGLVVGTEKKYGTANTKSNPEGQRLTKLDATDDVVAVKKVDVSVGKAIQQARQEEIDSKRVGH